MFHKFEYVHKLTHTYDIIICESYTVIHIAHKL